MEDWKLNKRGGRPTILILSSASSVRFHLNSNMFVFFVVSSFHCKSFPLLLQVFFILCSIPTIGAQRFISKSCSKRPESYANDSAFEANLDLLLSSFSSNSPGTGFYNFTAGEGPDRAYGLFLCRGDVAPDSCRNCVASAARDIKHECRNSKSAVAWRAKCLLRYSDERFFSAVDNAPMRLSSTDDDAEDPKRFDRTLSALLSRISPAAAASARLFAAGSESFSRTQEVYGLVQCTRDLSPADCGRCIGDAVSAVGVCCRGKKGGMVLGGSCYLRYESYPFYEEDSSGGRPENPSTNLSAAPKNSIGKKRDFTLDATAEAGEKKRSSRIVIPVVVPLLVGLVVGSFITTAWVMRRKNRRKSIVMSESRHEMGEMESLQFDLATIKASTNNFCDSNKLGQGGFGAVYKGKLPDGQEIAVKRLFRSSRQGLEEFMNEVVLVAKLQHKNLVRLLGCCLEGEEQILVFEYVPNQSLEKFLFDPIKRACLCWAKRYKIIGGIARGLLYLHEDSRLKIIHRDLKGSNVLLDEEMNPKISDFGTAKLFEVGQTQGNTSRITGTYGYMSPEYAMHGTFSIKSDVFSFGVLVLEIVTGLKNSGFFHSELAEDLPSYAWRHWNEGTTTELIDETLKDSCILEEAIRCIHIGLLCVQQKVADRPTMSSVLLMLNKDSVTLRPPLPPVFSDSNRRDGSEHDSITGELDLSSCRLLPPINDDTYSVEWDL